MAVDVVQWTIWCRVRGWSFLERRLSELQHGCAMTVIRRCGRRKHGTIRLVRWKAKVNERQRLAKAVVGYTVD